MLLANQRFLTRMATILAGVVLAITLGATTVQAQINIYIGAPPPPVRYEVRPALPAPGYGWVDGFWEPFRRSYRWHPGFWQQPPYEGAYYVHPHYDHYDQGWRLHEGYWSRENHGDRYEDGDRGGDHHDQGNHYGKRKHDKQDKRDKHDHGD